MVLGWNVWNVSVICLRMPMKFMSYIFPYLFKSTTLTGTYLLKSNCEKFSLV